MRIFEIILAVAFVAVFLGLSYGVKHLCRQYIRKQNCGSVEGNGK